MTLPTLSVAHEVRAIAPAGDAGIAWVRKRLDMARLSIDDVLSDRDAAPFHEILNDTQRLTDQIERVQAQRAAQQAAVDAARWSITGTRRAEHEQCGKSCIWRRLIDALAAFDKAQAAQPEGEQG